MTQRRPNTVRNACLALIGAAAIVWAALMLVRTATLPPRFAVVEPGVLYRSAQPNSKQLQTMIDRFGLRTLLIVREGGSERVTSEIDFAKSRGLNVIHIPVESRRAIPAAQVDEFFRCVDDRRNYPILIHCSAGRHRTGYLCARYRLDRQGWKLPQAIDELMSFGFDAKNQTVVLDQLRGYASADPHAASKDAVGMGASP